MAKWPEGNEPDPERFTVDMIVEKFWEYRPGGREYQSLREDAVLYLRGWVAMAGKKNVAEAYARIMEREEEDLALGGKPHTGEHLVDWFMGRWKPSGGNKGGGLKVYV